MTIKCPLCRLNDLQHLEFENMDELGEHCEEYHTVKTLAASFIEGYFAHKELRDKIHEKIEFLQNGYLDMSIIGTRHGAIELLKSLLDSEK
jgi:hypothetical protein